MPLYPPVPSGAPDLTGPLGFFGAGATTRPGPYTSALSLTNRAMGSYTANAQSSAYTGGLLDLLQAARLSDLNALRVSSENDRALSEGIASTLNALLTDLKVLGLIG